MKTVEELGPRLGVAQTCSALGVSRATYYRWQHPEVVPSEPRPVPARALSLDERQEVLSVLHESRFVDLSPAEIYATLLDEERYLCSERTIYRILAGAQEVRERRNQCRHPHYAAPELAGQFQCRRCAENDKCAADPLTSRDVTVRVLHGRSLNGQRP